MANNGKIHESEDGLDIKPFDSNRMFQNPDEIIDEDAIKIFGALEKILGDDPQKSKKEVNLHPTLVSRWKDWIVTGLSREVLDDLTEKYPRSGNVNLEPPILNPEVMHSLKETAQKRDKHFVYAQRLAGTALSSLGMAITSLLRDEVVDKLKLLELLSDSAKLLIEVHHKESSARIAYILPGMSKQIKAVLEETKPDTLLFGHGLTEKLQDAIALEKLGKELKATQNPTPQQQQLQQSAKKIFVKHSNNPKASGSGLAKWKNPTTRTSGYQGNHQGNHQTHQGYQGNHQTHQGYQGNHQTHQGYQGHQDYRPSRGTAHRSGDNRSGPTGNFHQKTKQTPYNSRPLRQQNQTRQQSNRFDDHRRS